MQHDVTCPECGATMILRRTQKFKWKNGEGRLFYGCSEWPNCKAVHGAHPDGRPLGIPGDAETKKLRIAAHDAFTSLCSRRQWELDRNGKRGAYMWLGRELGIPEHEIADKCHIAMFDKDICRRVIEICEKA